MKSFDLRTHIRDKKTGQVIVEQPYTLHIIDGEEIYERPIGSGQFYSRNGEEHPGHAVVALQKELKDKKAAKEQAVQARKEERAAVAKAAKAEAAAKQKAEEAALIKELSAKQVAAPAAGKKE